jgi:cytoskeletal protein CcmA (bactofilin family)
METQGGSMERREGSMERPGRSKETPAGSMAAKVPEPFLQGPSGQDPVRPTPSYISPGIKVRGTITADEDVYIDGDVQGSLSVPGHRLTVGESAYINAETVAREVVVYGAIQGGLCAFDRIEIKKHASVAGELATAKIVIEDGAHFKGAIDADGERSLTHTA